MSARNTITMMSNTGGEFNKFGTPVRADSYYGLPTALHTVQVVYNNLYGGFGIQATLSLGDVCNGNVTIPEEDWFWIWISDTDSEYPYITYPRDPLNPTGSPSTYDINYTGDTGTESFSFEGNFTYLRAVLTRDYIEPTPLPDVNGVYRLGQVDRVLLSM